MCWFNRKRKEEKEYTHLYNLGDQVKFKYRGEVTTGYIYAFSLNQEGLVIYDIQIGGECPAAIHDIPEEKIFVIKK